MAAVVGLGLGAVAVDLIQSQRISSLNSTISSLSTSLASVQSNVSASQSALADQPLYVDTVNKQIVLQAVVNDSAFSSQMMHGIVWDQGKNAEIAMLNATATPEEVYNALIALGATPGNAVQLTSPEGTLETGTPVGVSVTWKGAPQVYTLQQLINSYSGNFVFGGNLSTNTSLGTGCEVCLYSCAVGIVSSGTIGWETVSNGWTLNPSIVPKGGQAVTAYLKPQL